MLKKLCIMITILIIFTTIGICLLNNSSEILPNNELSIEKWDKDRSARLSDNSLKEENSFSEDNTQTRISLDIEKGKKLNIEQLNMLDTTSYDWWININKNHEPTTIPIKAKKILEKYNAIYQGDTLKRQVYLTFDEGYENGYTSRILDTLKANNVRALFFVTGPYVKSYGDLIKRMLAEGHQVGNHTINHLSLPKLTSARLEHELYGLEKNYIALTGKSFTYMRPPSGEYSEKVLAASFQLNYKTVFWSFAYRDFDINNQRGSDFAYKMVMDNIHNGAVILLHAVSRDNAEALDRIIKAIKEKGYTIEPFNL